MKNLAVVVGFLSLLTGQAAAGEEVTLDNPGLYDLQVVGFELANAAELEIEAIGVADSHNDPWISRWWREHRPRSGRRGSSRELPFYPSAGEVAPHVQHDRRPPGDLHSPGPVLQQCTYTCVQLVLQRFGTYY